MNIDVYFSPAVVDEAVLEGRVAVVIDVIRATSTMLEALANGARAIFPILSTEEAVRLASSLGREGTLLCGERKGLKVEGFDLGNSPSEYLPDVVDGKQLVMTTTNGTRGLIAAEGANRVLVASFMNLTAVTEALEEEEKLVIVCAGRDNRFALEDVLCAGAVMRGLQDRREEDLDLNDAGRAALDLALKYPVDVDFLKTTSAGKALERVDLVADLDLCADVDRHELVPEMRERQISLPSGTPSHE